MHDIDPSPAPPPIVAEPIGMRISIIRYVVAMREGYLTGRHHDYAHGVRYGAGRVALLLDELVAEEPGAFMAGLERWCQDVQIACGEPTSFGAGVCLVATDLLAALAAWPDPQGWGEVLDAGRAPRPEVPAPAP